MSYSCYEENEYIYTEEWYRTGSVDKPGIYLLTKETKLFNNEKTSATTFHIKVGMAKTKACRRAKQQIGAFRSAEIYTKEKTFLGYLVDKIKIREIKYINNPTIVGILEESYHEIFKERWHKLPSFGEEWFEVSEDFYNLVCEYGFNVFDKYLSCAALYLLDICKGE